MADELGIQCVYRLEVVDSFGKKPDTSELASDAFAFRMAPQALQIQRNIRSEVIKDLAFDVTIVSGGEGIGRVSIQGTHGVGQFEDARTASLGKATRDALVAFFEDFLKANDDRGKHGLDLLRMKFRMSGGNWSNPVDEAYYVWPESFPSDNRAVVRPHAWDWSLSMLLLGRVVVPVAPDKAKLADPSALASRLSDLESLVKTVSDGYKGALSTLQKAKDLRGKLARMANQIHDFVAGAKDAIYQVTDLARGSAQLCTDILHDLNVSDFRNDATAAFRGAVYECRRTVGEAAMTAAQFKRSGSIQSTFSGPRAAVNARPVSVPLSPGDSLQAIAARALGDASRWGELVTANGLEWPFIDFSGANGAPGSAYAGKRVLGATDRVKLPLPFSPGSVGIADDPIGRDLQEVQASAGDLVGGTENMAAAIIRRLRTPQGRIPWHPTYGSVLPSLVGSPGDDSSVLLAKDNTVLALRSDPRVLGVTNPSASWAAGVLSVSADSATPLGNVSASTPI